MASSSSSLPASRAILIPHGDPAVRPQTTGSSSQRHRPSTRFSRPSAGTDNTSTSLSSSEQDSSWPGSPATALLNNDSNSTTHPYRQRKDKAPVYSHTPPAPPTALSPHRHTPKRPPILSSSTPSNLSPTMLASSSYTSINLNDHRSSYNYGTDADTPPRLITYTKHAQGFTWNDELFLPSYLLGSRYVRRRGGSGHHRFMNGEGEDEDDEWDSGGGVRGGYDDEGYCPVTEIFVTDEEALRMMP